MNTEWEGYSKPDQELYDTYEALPFTDDNNPLQSCYLSCPKYKTDTPLVIWFHGGGMVGDHTECPSCVYDGNNAVAEMRYRVCPACLATAAIEDAAISIGWIFNQLDKYNFSPAKVFIGGMSAGAYLAALVTMNPEYGVKYSYSSLIPAGLIFISGQMTTHFKVKEDLKYSASQFYPVIDELAPMSYLSPDLPPILLVTGESGLDMPGRPEENAFMAASLKAIGHNHVTCHSLNGHDHGGAFASCDFLVTRFIADILAGV